jgi:ribosomal protein S18 acetylase RimI-like enzyme
VLDAYQGQGIGTFMLRQLLAIGRAMGLAGLTADVLADNSVMLHVFEESHCNIISSLAGGIYHLQLVFDPIQPRLN